MMDHAEAKAILAALFVAERIETGDLDMLSHVYARIAARIADRCRAADGMLLVGLCGAQGSGKSTAAGVLKALIERGDGLSVAKLSIDDLYLTAAERADLAARVHPLLRTRGVPGTHDVGLGIEIIERLAAAAPGDRTHLPSFDKARDDRRPAAAWPVFTGQPDIVLLEGWCVGARPQDPSALIEPVNALEAIEDSDGRWRSHVNAQLAGPYRTLFERIDLLVMFEAPGFEHVHAWRREQEDKLAARLDGPAPRHIMDAGELERFIAHYERLTRHMLAEMPDRADIVVALNGDRSVRSLRP